MRPWRQEPGPRTHASRPRGPGTSPETQEARRVSCSRGGLCGAAVTSTCSDTWGSVSGHLRERWKGPLSQPTPVLATRKTSSVGPRLSPARASAFQPASGVPLSSPGCVREVRESGSGFRPQDTAPNSHSPPMWDFVNGVGGALGSPVAGVFVLQGSRDLSQHLIHLPAVPRSQRGNQRFQAQDGLD